jgi:hypothetical protein
MVCATAAKNLSSPLGTIPVGPDAKIAYSTINAATRLLNEAASRRVCHRHPVLADGYC